MIPARHREPARSGEAGGFVISVDETTLVKGKTLETPPGGSPTPVRPDFLLLSPLLAPHYIPAHKGRGELQQLPG